MQLSPIPYRFVRERLRPSWQDVLWGYDHQKIGWSFVVDFAMDRLCEGSDNPLEIELAGLTKMEAYQVGDLLREIAGYLPEKDTALSRKKWLYLLLAWLYEHKDSLDDPLGEVEIIYSEFDYPFEIKNFVRYMPATDGYDPTVHTQEENIIKIFENWRKYLNDAKSDLNP